MGPGLEGRKPELETRARKGEFAEARRGRRTRSGNTTRSHGQCGTYGRHGPWLRTTDPEGAASSAPTGCAERRTTGRGEQRPYGAGFRSWRRAAGILWMRRVA